MKYYVTTPIYYVNDKPHIGHAYCTLAADVLARWNRQLKKETVFLTGTDEHGQKIQTAAEKNDRDPQLFVDEVSQKFKDIWKELQYTHDRFIRTTDADHKEVSQDITKKCFANGDIYLGKYSGWYSVQDETYFKEDELVDGKAPSGHEVKWVEEEAYFFKLSKYQDKLLEYYENNPEFISPKYRKLEFINRVKEGLRDLCISRTNFKWGIPLPMDENHITYVWFDALTNYLTGAGYLHDEQKFAKMWPADVQIVGKDIGWFHVVIWPAMLMSAGIELPKKVYIHGFITVHGDKMSKSKGNVKDPAELTHLGIDIFRYYFLRYIPFGQDSEFSELDYYTKLNTDLANDLGNLVSRTNAMIKKYMDGGLPGYNQEMLEEDLTKCDSIISALAKDVINASDFYEEFNDNIQNLNFHMAFARLWEFIGVVNKFVNDSQPWNLAKENKELEIKIVMEVLVESIRLINNYIAPVLIETNKKLEDIFGFRTNNNFKFDIKHPEIGIEDSGVVFKKFDLKEYMKAQDDAKKKDEDEEYNKLTPFQKLDLRVAHIESVFDHPEADKLYLLQLDLGPLGKRQIVAGMKEHFKKEELEGHNIVLLSNLKPKKIRNQTSHGMMLACEQGEGDNVTVGFLTADNEPGTKIILKGSEKDSSDINEIKKRDVDFKVFLKTKLIGKDGKVYLKNNNQSDSQKEELNQLMTFNDSPVSIVGVDEGNIC